MKPFDASQIERMNYSYQGAVGGVFTAARVQFKGPVKVREGIDVGKFDPHTLTQEPAALEFRHKWEVHCGGTSPAWFDFPFDRPVRMIRECHEAVREKTPSSHGEWYIDDEQNVVYFLGGWG